MTVRKYFDKALEYFLVLILAVLVIDVLWQVISRYMLKSPSSFTDELARFLLIWVGILGSAYATGKRMHLAIDALINKLSPVNRRKADIIINLAVAVFALLVMVVGGINLMYILLKLGNTSPALSLPIGFVYSVIPISGLIIIYYSLCEIFLKEHSDAVKTAID